MDALFGARVPMEPVGLSLRYVDVGSGNVCAEERDSFTSFSDETLSMDVSFDDEVIEVAVEAGAAVLLESAQVRLRHAFSSDEMVLMNGYQSWTDTREMPAWERMRGLRGVHPMIVDRWALDGGGDYGIVRYTGRRGEQHGFTYATFRRGEGLVLVGSLDESHGLTFIRADANNGEVTLETEPPARSLEVGERVTLGRYAITRGTLDECYDRWFELAGIEQRPARPLVGYTSWHRHYGDIDESKLLHDLAGITAVGNAAAGDAAAAGSALRHDDAHANRDGASTASVTRLFLVDDGYCKVGDWLEVDSEKFPRGLAPISKEIREAGFVPGLWVAPFVCERGSRVFDECPEWLLRDESGEPVRTGPHWSGGYALDTRNVEVRSYILDVLSVMTQDWGFGLLKADFLYAACMCPHDGLNRGELMADAMGLLRRGVGEDVMILGCGVPLGSVFGKVEYCRIGCDVGLDWDGKLHMRPLHRERVSTKRALANTYYREPLDGRAFGNDPDAFFLRDDVKLTDTQRDELLFADADCGSVFLTSDDRALWDDAARARYEEALRVFRERHGR